MKYLILGGSRNIGYLSTLRLLAAGHTVTLLLRRSNTFDQDETMKKYIASGKARIIQGDSLQKEDVARSWTKASEGDDPQIDGVIFTIGTYPTFSLTKGFVQTPANLCAQSLLNVLSTWPHDMAQPPKLVVLTSNGLTKKSHAALPFLLKGLYGTMLAKPHADKLGAERLLFHVSGNKWTEPELKEDILPSGWQSQLREGPWLQDYLILRPALYTDGECRAEIPGKKPCRTGDETLPSSWTVSRKDVAYWIVMNALPEWNSWKGQCVTLAY